MSTHFETPLSGNPPTVQSTDKNGNPQFRLRPRVLTPERAQVADGFRTAMGVVLFLCYVVILFGRPRFEAAFAIPLGLALIAVHYLLGALVRQCLRRRSTIVMTTESIRIRRWHGWKKYDRTLEHRFALAPHDRVRDEQRQHEYEIRKASANGKAVSRAVYYGESFHVVLVYAGHRVDLLTVYGPNPAGAIVARLQYCDRCLNEVMKMGGGISHSPDDEWEVSPGGLDDA